jgi:hypothetical protein
MHHGGGMQGEAERTLRFGPRSSLGAFSLLGNSRRKAYDSRSTGPVPLSAIVAESSLDSTLSDCSGGLLQWRP